MQKRHLSIVLILGGLSACSDGSAREELSTAQSCMTCHNGSQQDDYSGPGIENPHPFGNANSLSCTDCHGGNPNGADKEASHVPPPPEIGDREQLTVDRTAYFNRLTLTGIDKFADYTVNGQTYTALDYLQFINPGDLRVVDDNRSCGQCHEDHTDSVMRSLLATEAGMLSGAMYAAGVDNEVPESVNRYSDTAADKGFRAVTDDNFQESGAQIGAVARLLEYPVFSQRNSPAPDAIHNSDLYLAADLADDVDPVDNSLISNSPLANLYHEQVAFTCGDCHLGSAGANNRYGDFRSSGCTACHMRYSLSGRSASGDPNVDPFEPLDVDDIDEPELPHIRRHMIQSVAKTLPSGEFVEGIDDYTCAGCHQGSNRTVMQYWGIRLDQNQDLRRGVQYPANPNSFTNTNNDARLFDPVVNNQTFNGRNRNQYILEEDYDGDDRDDTPADVHYDAGMGCIDCHGSYDLHGGDVDAQDPAIYSRMEQAVAIRCESCHGTILDYAETQSGENYAGVTADLAIDSKGNLLDHVFVDSEGAYWLRSKLTGNMHYLPQTKDTVWDNGKVHPVKGDAIYSEKASYAMGRNDGDASTGIGPLQTAGISDDFYHGESMSCEACHSSWTNSCIGCHLEGEYNTGNNFSNITGERIVFREKFAEFVYQTPVPFQLGIDPNNRISPIAPNTETFFRYEDLDNNRSEVFAFSDRGGRGNNTSQATHPSLSHNVMMPHSIRGKVDDSNEGPRYCTACHLTDDALTNYGTQYDTFRTAMAGNDFASLDFTMLQQHIGRNTNNAMDSPIWVHMVTGLGSGLFLFDEHGCPINPLDEDDDRFGCEGVAPADNFDLGRAVFNLDRIVVDSGQATGSNNHPLLETAEDRRDGSDDSEFSGPLGATLIQRLADPVLGLVLDSWLDSDAGKQGDAEDFLPPSGN